MNKRNIIIITLSTIVVLGLGVWFFLAKNSNLPKYIPAKALGVLKINPLSIGTKINMDEVKNMKFYDKMIDEMDDGGVDMDELFKSPAKTGVSMTDNIYLFSEMKDDEMNGALLISVSDKGKLRDFLEKFAKKNDLKFKESDDLFMYIPKEEEDKYRGEELNIVWNDDVCLFYLAREDGLKSAKKLLSQSKENSILSSASFNESEDNGGDVSLFLNNNSLRSVLNDAIEDEHLDEVFPDKLKKFMDNVEGSSFVLNFNDESIQMEGHQYFKDEDKVTDFNIIGEKGIDDKNLNYISSNGNVLMGLSAVLNMEQIFAVIKSLPNYSDFTDEIQESIGLTESDMKNLFDGSMTFSINEIRVKEVEKLVYDYENYNPEYGDFESSYQMVPQAIPVFSIQLGLKTAAVYKKLTNKLKELAGDRLVVDGNRLVIPTNEIIGDVNLVQVDNRVVITNDEKAAKTLKSSGKWDAELNGDLKKVFGENPIAGYMNLDLESYGDKKLKTIFGYENSEYRVMKKVMSNFTSLSFGSSLKTSQVSVNMKKSSANSLMRIIHIMDEMVSEKR